MLQFHDVGKSFGDRPLFEGVSFAMNPRERLGVIGRNGSGKTTLFRMILGEESIDQGKIDRPRNYQIGYLDQHLHFAAPSILEEACLGLPEMEGGWKETHRAEEVLMGLGFAVEDFERPPSEFSGGFQVRLQLAKVLLSQPDLLLLDEPTNYLDIVSVRWLERFLRNWRGEVILITHDRGFMDKVCTHTVAIHRARLRRVEGPTHKLVEIIAQDEEIYERTRINEAKARKQSERFVERFRAKASKARQVQSRIKQLEKNETKEELAQESNLNFRFRPASFQGAFAVRVKELEFGYGDDASLMNDVSFELEPTDRLAIIGKNGRGKSTLLNLMAGELEARDGEVRRHDNTRLAHFGQNNIDRLHAGSTIEEEILSVHPDHDRQAARGICGLMMFQGDDALKKVDVLSGGERARVLLGKLLVSPATCLFLDEPTNHLDMESIEALMDAIDEFPGAVVVVTHDERVLHSMARRLVVFDRGSARVFEGSYQDFLDRVGWADEEPPPGAGPTATTDAAEAPRPRGKTRKPDRKKRAEIVKERSKVLGPIKKEMDALERGIYEMEDRAEKVEEALSEASTAGDAEQIVALSKELTELRQQIEHDFGALEQVATEHQERSREFDALLDAD